MRKKLNRIGIFVFSAIMAASMTACGGKTDATTEAGNKAQQEAEMQALINPDFIYVPTEINLGEDTEAIDFYNMKLRDGYLYYQQYTYDDSEEVIYDETYEESEEGDYDEEGEGYKETVTLVKKSLADGSIAETSFELEEGFYASYFDVDSKGNYVLLLQKWDWDEKTEESSVEYRMASYTSDGSVTYSEDIMGSMSQSELDYISGISVDGGDNVYLFAGSKCYLFDANGKSAGNIDVSNGGDTYISAYGQGKNGKMYVAYYSYSNASSESLLAELNADTKSVEKTYAHFSAGYNGGLVPASETTFLTNDGTSVYEYDLTTQESKRLFNWLDSDMNGQNIQSMNVGEDGIIYATYYNYDNMDKGLVQLVKTDSSQVAKKQVLVVGTLYSDSELMNAATKFNKANDKYRITVKTYIDNFDEWSETTFLDAITAMNNDIISGNGPDLFDLSDLNVGQLVSKGVLVDLTPYLENSTKFKRSDFFEGILDAYSLNGVQYAIPRTFSIDTVVGSATDLGNKSGWTLSEMVEYGKQHPGVQLFHGMTQEYAMYFCMAYNQDSFINWATGECNFNSKEFESLLEFVKLYPDGDSYEYDGVSDASSIDRGETLLTHAYIYNFEEIQMYDYMFGNNAAFIGYPTGDGSNGHMLSASSLYGISSTCSDKEGAWAFIENFLADASMDPWSFGFTTLKSEFEKAAAETIAVEYCKDENGNLILDEDGNPIESGGGGTIGYEDGWTYTYHTPTKEEVAKIEYLIAHAKASSSTNDAVLDIINEEAAAYFKGQKSVSDVAAIIQSRVQLYVDENH